jgi:Transglycosylase SLT domain
VRGYFDGRRGHVRAGPAAWAPRKRFKGGGGTNTVVQSQQPPQQVLNNYENAYQTAQNVTQAPYQPYTGSLIAGFTPMQEAGFGDVNTAINAGQPFVDQASQYMTNAATTLDPSNFGGTVAQYQSPYTQQVVNATEAQMNNQNAIQQNQLAGNAASAGAFGGDRQAVAQSVLAGQQQAQEAPTIANLYNTGFQNATSAAQSNAWLNSQAGFGMGQLGSEAQQQGLTAANAELTAGGQQQQLAQQEMNAPYESYLAAQAYPFQMSNFLTSAATGTGSLSGGTGSTTSPGPSLLSQGAGLGIAGLGGYGLLNNSGALSGLSGLFGSGAALSTADAPFDMAGAALADSFIKRGGRVGYANGGQPTDPLNFGYGVPDLSITLIPGGTGAHGQSTIPRPPQAVAAQPSITQDLQQAGGMASLGKTIGPIFQGDSRGGRVSLDSLSDHLRHMPQVPVRPRGFDFGGSVEASGASSTPAGLSAGVAGNPQLQQLVQTYSGLPTEQLQELAARTSPNSPQGALAKRALMQRQMNPQSNPGQNAVPTGGMTPMQGFADGGAPLQMTMPDQVGGLDPIVDQLDTAIHGQESNGQSTAPTSVNGAVGGYQIMPATFQQYAQPGESITNPADNSTVGKRIISDLTQKYAGDPARVAVAYFSGPGNVAPPDSPTPWRTDAKDGNGTTTSQYVGSVLNRLRASQPEQPASSPSPPPTAGMAPMQPDQPTAAPPSRSSSSPWETLLAAGLGIMGGTSKFPLVNIGRGGMEGLQFGAQQQKIQAEEDARRATQAQTAAYQTGELGLRKQQLQQTGDLSKAELAQKQAQMAQQAGLERARLDQTGSYQTGELAQRSAALAETAREHDQSLVPPDVREAQWYQNASPEQQKSFRDLQFSKKGMIDIFGNPTAASAQPTGGAIDLHGDDYLKTLNPTVQSTVKAMAEGRMAMPTRPTPQQMQLIQAVGQYDPTFDTTDFNKRNKTATDFSSGGMSGKAVGAINTALPHLAELDDKITQIGNGNYPLVNSVSNWISTQTGAAGPMSAKVVRDAAASELRKVFAGASGGSLEELRNWQENFPINGSPAQQKAALREAVTLMDSRLNSLGNSYSVGMGTNHSGIDLISPTAREAYEKLTGAEPTSGSVRPPVYNSQRSGSAAQPSPGTQGAPAAPAWKYNYIDPSSKTTIHSNDGSTWFDAAGKPYGAPP